MATFRMPGNLCHILLLFLLFAFRVLSQSEVTGDIGAKAPYGIPADTFSNLTSNPTLQGTNSVGGFDISSSKYNQISGWQLSLAITADVPLTDAKTDGIDTSKVTETTVMSLLAPADMTSFDEKAWQVCVVVYPYVNMTAVAMLQGNNSTATNSSTSVPCGSWLGDECNDAINRLGSILAINGCTNSSLPQSCEPYFENTKGTTSFFIDGDAMEDGRFYAWGSAPTDANDQSAIAAAENQLWPMTFNWFYDGGIYTFYQCIQATNADSASSNGTSHPTPSASSRNTAHVWSVVALAVVVAAF